jgi:lipopolysaccharide biosynthesis glycosyltransferase
MFVADDNYIEPLIVALNSIFVNNPIAVHVFLVSDGLKKENLALVQDFITKNGGGLHYIQCDLEVDAGKMQSQQWGTIVYQRIYGMFHIKEEKILYLDCDLIVDKSLKELYDTELGAYYAAAVRDSGMDQFFINGSSHIKKLMIDDVNEYFNSGVLLLNLKKIQVELTLGSLMEKIDKYGDIFLFPDQDLLNMVWKKKVKFIDLKYNRIATDFAYRKQIEKDTQVVIYHYTGNKPWEKWDRNGRQGYQWCISKYLQYSNIPEAQNIHRLTQRYNYKLKDFILSKLKTRRGYNPFVCIKKADWKTFWDYLFFYV